MAKPMPYDQTVVDAICLRLIEGETLREICRDEAMPSHPTVYRWLAANDIFRTAYARAREHQCDAWADVMREIADDARNDFMDRIAKDGGVERVFDSEHVQRSRLRIDTLKWLLSKYSPRRFGDKLDVNVGSTIPVSDLSDAELEAKTKARLKALGIEVPDRPLLLGLTKSPAVDRDNTQDGI